MDAQPERPFEPSDIQAAVQHSVRTGKPLRLNIDPGTAEPKLIAELFSAISDLNRAYGGPGYRIDGNIEPETKVLPIAISYQGGEIVVGPDRSATDDSMAKAKIDEEAKTHFVVTFVPRDQ